jgi:epoxide hydrolase-like predicted phosphatase
MSQGHRGFTITGVSHYEALRGLVIDWGGVLTNSIRSTVTTWVEAEGIDWDSYVACMRPWLNEAYGGPAVASNPVHALERGECTVAEFERLFASRLVRTDGGPVPSDGLLGRMFAASETVPAMYELLRKARSAGVRTCLLSNSWGSEWYDRTDFGELFDGVVISCEVGMRKPEPEIFRHAAGLIGLPASACVFVDDVEANITAAEACGMTGVHHFDPFVTTERVATLLSI